MEKKERHYAYFANRACEYFPCHATVDEENFNCLFCFCPLYPLGHRCGGNFTYRENGIKDCSACLYPHQRQSYDSILERYHEIVEAMAEMEGKEKKAEGDK